MAPTKKSIYRQAGAQHFQLVHRSVRDPLINDPEASQQVFKQIGRYNESNNEYKSGYSLADLEGSIDKSKIRENEGEAALYGITYDDSGYDYMSHLKPVGESGFESVLLAAPSKGSGVAPGMKRQGLKGKGKAREEDMFEMPDSVLPSQHELSVQDVYASQQAIPPELQGLQPDMDPHLRQVLEALDDDAFVDDAGKEDFFDELLGTGEVDDCDDQEEFDFEEWGVEDGEAREDEDGDDDDDDAKTEGGQPEETWEDRFRAFKAAGGKHAKPVSNGGWDSDEDKEVDPAERSEMADTIGSLVSGMGDLMVRGGKKRHGKRGPSDASGMSMSSSSVYRTDALRTLDERFDRLEREYEMDDEDDEWYDDEDDDVSIAPSYVSTSSFMSHASRAHDEPPEVSREDFDAIMDDFLENYEVVGGRMRESLGGTGLSGADKLKIIRASLEDGDEGIGKEENRRRILEIERIGRRVKKEKKDKLDIRDVEPQKEDKWDVETILSTYTNTENHPGMIRSRNPEEARRRAQRRAEAAERRAAEAATAALPDLDKGDDDHSGSDTETETTRKVTVSRKKGESAEDRKARKAAVKAERASRRAEKKAHTQVFGDERKRQIASHNKAVGGGRAADLNVGATKGVVPLR